MNPFKKPSFLKRRDRGRSYNAEDTPVQNAPASPAPDATDANPRETVASNSSLPHPPRQFSQSLTLVPQANESIRSPSPSPSEAFTVAGPDPLGLKVLHTPPQEREVDIVFIHGLGGTSRGTWTKSKDLESFWPLKFLPLEPVIQDARILTFGYQAKFQPGAGKNKMSILDFAKDLLFDLRYAKDESAPELRELGMGERPIIFVVHSMGGLIVKEAYMQGQNDPKYESIIKAVSAIVFLSTPHRGTNLAETLNRILQVSFKTSPMKFIAELSAGSEKLEVLNDQFRHVAPKLEIVSFYETRPTTIFKKTQIMVLEKDSSVLGYPGEVSKPLDADHNSICKYESRLDPRYITVRNVLRSLVGTAKPRSKDGQETEFATQMVPFEQLLATPELPERDLHFFQERWSKGTCSWILKDATFKNWAADVESFESRVLCLQGNAASGKSVLSSFIIQHLVQEGKLCHYFFIRFEDKKKRSPSTVLRTLAGQLARSNPTYASRLRERINSGIDLKRADLRTVWKLLYKQALLDHGLQFPLYWVIDGLDEAEDAAALVNVLADLQHAKIPLRIIMTSRPTHEINTALRNLGKVLKVEFAGIEGNQDDFRSYINTSMDLAGNDTYQRQIESQILQRAKGNFLWVHLAVQTISQCQTRVDVSKALDELPTGMEAFYKRMASAVPKESNSNDPTLGERILQWATFAQRPLRLSELTDALQNDGVLELERTIGHLCGGFVVVDQTGVVTLIHESAREYLTRKQDQEHGIMMERRTTHDKLFARCMAMLTGSSLRSLVSRDRSPDFVEYASGAWFFHLAHGRPTTEHNLSILVDFLEGQHALLWIQIIAKRGQLKLLIAASRSLNALVMQLRRMNEGASLLHQHASALFESWAADLVKLVGKFGSALLAKPDAIFKLIPPFCPEESVLYRQYGQKESRTMKVSGFSRSTWDDCLARLPLEQGAMSTTVLAVGDNIVILANKRSQGHIYVFGSTTFEMKRRFTHPERVHTIQVDNKGEHLVSYGWKTTRIWTLASGKCIRTVQNPKTRPRPLSLLFIEDSKKVVACGDDRSIRVLCVDDDANNQWGVLTSVEEESQEDTMTILNAPACAALSPDGDMVVFGYRGHPVTLWDLVTVEPVRQCYISGKHMGTEEHVQTLGEITSLAWHPFSGEVFGLQREGLLFKWDTNEDDASATVQAGAHYLSVSTDGSLVVTGNTSGTLKVFLSGDLTLIYQLSSQDHVLGVAFSADSTLLYDIRGSYGNIWEPNALARLTESSEYSEHLSDAGSDYESLAKLSLRTEHTFPGVDAITAVAAQDPGQLYCYGTEQGVAILCVVGKGMILEVQRSPSFMSVEHICWSDDGQMLAIADLSREIVVRRISKGAGPDQPWVATQMIRTRFQSGYEHISQLLFEPRSHRLLAASSAGLLAIGVDSGEEQTAALPSNLTTVRWAIHPTKDDYLLGFDTGSIHAFNWSSLEKVYSYKYVPPMPESANSGLGQNMAPDRATLQSAEVTIGRVLVTRGSSDAVMELVQPASCGSPTKQYLIFTLQNLPGLEDFATKEIDNLSIVDQPALPYSLVPLEVASRIREPLGIVARGKLLYLDVDKWICTWRLPSTTMRSSIPRRGSEQSITHGIERPYFLPGDWVTANEARLCVATRNGTLICPRNGDAATVQYLRPL